MPPPTPIASRLQIALDDEYRKMQNEWFFKWHFIGRDGPVEIESFNGKPIRCGGIAFDGSAHQVYWDTIQRYLRKKIVEIFGQVESDLSKYPLETRVQTLNEIRSHIRCFAFQIQRAAIEKDRILRGDGVDFPPEHDFGKWNGSQPGDVDNFVNSLRRIYCRPEKPTAVGEVSMMDDMMNDTVTLVKKGGEALKNGISANVSPGLIVTFESDLQVEVGDHFLRELPSGLVEDFIVVDPVFYGDNGPIGPHYQVKVSRSGEPPATPSTVINNISGQGARVNINSTDKSTNLNIGDSSELFAQLSDAIVKSAIDSEDRENLLRKVKELQSATGDSSFKEKYQEFIAVAASHMTIIGPFIPALTRFL